MGEGGRPRKTNHVIRRLELSAPPLNVQEGRGARDKSNHQLAVI